MYEHQTRTEKVLASVGWIRGVLIVGVYGWMIHNGWNQTGREMVGWLLIGSVIAMIIYCYDR